MDAAFAPHDSAPRQAVVQFEATQCKTVQSNAAAEWNPRADLPILAWRPLD